MNLKCFHWAYDPLSAQANWIWHKMIEDYSAYKQSRYEKYGLAVQHKYPFTKLLPHKIGVRTNKHDWLDK